MEITPMAANSPYRSVIFDMDNTLFDLYTAKMRACQSVVDILGAGEAGDLFDYFLRWVGRFEDPGNIRDFMVDNDCYDQGLFAECSSVYRDVKHGHLVPYPGVGQTLRLLADQGYRLAVVTDASRPDAETRLSRTGLLPFFDPVVTPESTGSRKPSTLPFLHALVRMESRAAETVLVGDSPRRDIAPGNALGMTTVYARYGDRYSGNGRSGNADHTIDAFPDLTAILDGNVPRTVQVPLIGEE